jgi:hypothetical protein
MGGTQIQSHGKFTLGGSVFPLTMAEAFATFSTVKVAPRTATDGHHGRTDMKLGNVK